MANEFSQFPDYQSLTPGTKGQPGKANRSIPDRVEMYGVMDYVVPGCRVLDLGCNRGFFGTYLSPHIGSYVGIEGDQGQLAHSQRMPNMDLKFMNYRRLDDKFNIILCLAFHSYVGIPMKQFADDLDSMLAEGGTIFLEGHPKGYRGEPELYMEPLVEYLKRKFYIVEHKMVPDRELFRPFYILKRMAGMVSTCTKVGDSIIKQYFDPEKVEKAQDRNIKHHFEQEVLALEKLEGEKHVPKLLGYSREEMVMELEYCGDRITKYNKPDDWLKQCKEIVAMQNKHKIHHWDLFQKNITVKDGIIYLIDWGIHGITPKKGDDIYALIKSI